MTEKVDPVLETIAKAKVEMGRPLLFKAIKIIDAWEDSTETATELAYRLWELFRD